MADWDGKYISPYAEHGKRVNKSRKLLFLFQLKY